MEITLEKIELVKDRTGVTYAEAKQALEENDGSVVDAIIDIEETVNAGKKERSFGDKGTALFKKLKELVKKGNVARIQVKREEDTILNVPLNAGILGIAIAPLASVVAVVAAFGFKCSIEVIKTDGTIIDVSDAVTDTVSNVAERGSEAAEIVKGKAAELRESIEIHDADGIICDDELTASQMRNLAELTGAKVIDRTTLILDIFAAHARTREGKLQVEIAQQKYRYARLRGMGEALSRLGAGIGTRGPGETKLETDRRVIQKRIKILSDDIEAMKRARDTARKKRSSNAVPTAAIVGYTNAGKSTLLNGIRRALRRQALCDPRSYDEGSDAS